MSELNFEDIERCWNEIQDTFSSHIDAMYKQILPLILIMEDEGLLPPTYDDDILEPESEVFV